MAARTLLGISFALAAALSGCGEDEPPPPPPRPTTPTAAAQPAAVAGAKSNAVERRHIEDNVTCPIPDQPTDPKDGKCDPKVPTCGEHLYCLRLAQGTFCEPCAERDGIRHAFRERDFDPQYNRDPFQIETPGSPPTQGGPRCPRDEQRVASSYSYADLKLVGIVAQGTQRKVLMMGGPLGYIIKRGDCVGKEKAVVKDIGLGYITFQLDPDEVSIQLNPKQLTMNEPELPFPTPATPGAAAAPPTTISPVAPGAPGAPAAPPTTISPAPPGGQPARGAAAAPGPGTAPAAPAAGQVRAPAAAPAAAPPAAPVIISPSPARK
jgi:hypothetical protein